MHKVIDVAEKTFLIVIGLFTVMAMGQEVLTIVERRYVELKDLLLMFIFAEVIGMLGIYYSSKRIPIDMPLFIAVTALARLIILGDKENLDGTVLLYEGGAILLIACAGFILRYRRFPEAERALPSVKDKD
jgi:protein PsiE